MIFIPDLFGSYQKGRESAIDANWKDLQNYESIENARHQNDAAALTNLATMADYGKERQLKSNQVTNSDLETGLNQVSQIGKLYGAGTNNRLGEVQYNTVESNIPLLYDIAGANLVTFGNTAFTNQNNSGTNRVNSQIVYDVTTGTFVDTLNAAHDTQRASNAVARAQAKYAPTIAEYQGQTGVINAKTGKIQAQDNYVVSGINAQYSGQQAHLTNQGQIQTLRNSLLQGGLDEKTWKQKLATFDTDTQNAALSSALVSYEQAGDIEGANKIRRMIADNQRKSYGLAGGTGSIPILSATTGQQIGTANPDGTVSRTSGTGRAIQVPTTQVPTTQVPTTQVPTTTTGVSLFGTPNIPTTTGTRAVVTNNPMGGHNYTGDVSNWDALVNSDAGQYIQNLFFRK